MVWKKRDMPRVRHTKKPDADNLIKGVWDALDGIVWRDDTQICVVIAEKWIAAGDEQPHVIIELEALADE